MGTNTIKFLTIALLFLGTCKASSVFILYGRDALNDIDSKIGQMNDEDYFAYRLGQMDKENSKTTNFDEKNKIENDVELIKADQFDDSSAENHISDNWNQKFDKKNNENDYFQLSKNVDKDVEMLPDNFELEKKTKKTNLINEINTEINKNDDQFHKISFEISKPCQHVYRIGPYEIQMQISFYDGNLNDIGNMNANEININRLFGSIPDPVIEQFNPAVYEERTVTYQFDPEIDGGNTETYDGNTDTYQDPQDYTENYGSDEVEIIGSTTEQQVDEVDPEINEENTETNQIDSDIYQFFFGGNTDKYQVDSQDYTEKYGSDEVEIIGSTTEQQYVDPEINEENTETNQIDSEIYQMLYGGNTVTYYGNTDTYQVDPEINEDKTEKYGSDEVEIFEGTTEQQYDEVVPEINEDNTEKYGSDEVETNVGNTEEPYQYSNTDRYANNFEETNKFVEPGTHFIQQDDIDLYDALDDLNKQHMIMSTVQDYLGNTDLGNTNLGNTNLGNTNLRNIDFDKIDFDKIDFDLDNTDLDNEYDDYMHFF